MSTWPPSSLPSSGPYPRTDATTNHPYQTQDHNDFITHINDIVERIGAGNPKTASYVTTESRLETRSRSATFVLAPYDAPDFWKESADIVLSGPNGSQNDAEIITYAMTLTSAGGGGTVLVGPGTVHIYHSIAFSPGSTDNVTLVGAGAHATTLQQRADVPVIYALGSGIADSQMCKNVLITGFFFAADNADGATAWNSPAIQIFFAKVFDIRNCNFFNIYCAGILGIAWWDSVVSRVRIDNCGSLPTSTSQYGSLALLTSFAGMDCNNIYVSDLWIETWNGVAIQVAGSVYQQINKINFDRVKLENAVSISGPFITVDRATYVNFHDLGLYMGDWRASGPAYSTAINAIDVTNSSGVMFTDTFLEIGSPTHQTIRTAIRFSGGNRRCGWENLTFSAQASPNGVPSVSFIEFTGTNTEMLLGDYGFAYDGSSGSAVALTGSPTSASGVWRESFTAVTGSGATTINPALTKLIILTLSANTTLTISSPANTQNDSRRFKLMVKQDASGGRTLSWPTIKWPGGSAPTVSSAANAVDVFEFFFQGSSWYGIRVGTALA